MTSGSMCRGLGSTDGGIAEALQFSLTVKHGEVSYTSSSQQQQTIGLQAFGFFGATNEVYNKELKMQVT
jgi:hypothetical protein